MNYIPLKLVVASAFIMLFSFVGIAQSHTAPVESYDAKLTFEGEELKEDITLIVSKQTKFVRLSVQGKVKGGKASAGLYTKGGRRVCGLQLKARKGGHAKGNMEEEIEVRDGIYILKVRNDNGHGHLNIQFSQR